ncbi:MAG TPA: histidine triad nucleotide-binding protein [Acidimicrobiales bacterium]|nr:histidine triad nucleotide-binding protein [Acidimicrobiales bacterium]
MSEVGADPDCVFCGIVAGSVPADVVHRGEHTIAFRDLHPQAPVHVLVIPRRHVENAATVSHDDAVLLAEMLVAARRVAEAEGIAEPGYRLVFNVGDDGGNTVGHLHLHVIGGRRMGWPPG